MIEQKERAPNLRELKKGLGQFAQALPLLPKKALAYLEIAPLRSSRLEIVHPENLDLIQELLMTRSVIVGANHHGFLEPVETIRVLRDKLKIPFNKIGAFASNKFFDGRMGKMETSMIQNMQILGAKWFPIMQTYDTEYDDKTKITNNIASVRAALRMLKVPGSAMVIYPEGTRTKIVRKAQEGIYTLLSLGKKCSFFVPLAFEKTGGSLGKQAKTFVKGIKMTVGSPIELAQITEESKKYGLEPQDIMMLHVTELLPTGKRGYYEAKNNKRFFEFYEREILPKTSAAILGAGSIGTLLGTEFTKSTPTIDVVAGVRESQITKTQKVFEETGVKTVTVKDVLASNPEIVFIATQNPVDKILDEIEQYAKPGTTLVFLQNGVEVIAKAIERFGSDKYKLVRGNIYTPVNQKGMAGYKLSKLRVSISSVGMGDLDKEAALKVQELFQRAGFDTVYCEDYQAMEWAKLLSNLVGTTGSVTGLSLGETIHDRELFELELKALKDRLAILQANGIELPENIPWLKQVKQLQSIPVKVALTMRDVIARVAAGQRKESNATARKIKDGIKTEALYYHNPFIEAGKKVGLSSVVDKAILSIIELHEKGILNINAMTLKERKDLLIGKIKIYKKMVESPYAHTGGQEPKKDIQV